jgi:DNA-directed RNA polymerase beta' subunit
LCNQDDKPERPLSCTTGYIRLELPVFHVGYFKNIVAILQCVCKTCARVMVPEDERRQYLRRFRSPHTEVRRHPPACSLACFPDACASL